MNPFNDQIQDVRTFGLKKNLRQWLSSAGTSEGAKKAWDTRGRGGSGVFSQTHKYENTYASRNLIANHLESRGYKFNRDGSGNLEDQGKGGRFDSYVFKASHPDGHTATITEHDSPRASVHINGPQEDHDSVDKFISEQGFGRK